MPRSRPSMTCPLYIGPSRRFPPWFSPLSLGHSDKDNSKIELNHFLSTPMVKSKFHQINQINVPQTKIRCPCHRPSYLFTDEQDPARNTCDCQPDMPIRFVEAICTPSRPAAICSGTPHDSYSARKRHSHVDACGSKVR